MRLTNKHNLPETIIRATKVRNDNYNAGRVHRSVTQLINPPRVDMLRKRHFEDIEVDVSEEWWALFGTAVHHILEWGAEPGKITEERLFTTVDGWRISGMLDCQTIDMNDHVEIMDYKVTASYSITSEKQGFKPEWEQQLNMQAYLAEQVKGKPVSKLSILAIIRDWTQKKAQFDKAYPIAPIVEIQIPLWSDAEREAFIKERIRLHRYAEMMAQLGEDLPECTDEDRWSRDHKYAAMKKGGQRARKVFDDQKECEAYVLEQGEEFFMEVRPGEPKRCMGSYCMVAKYCDQWQRDPRNPNYGEVERNPVDKGDVSGK